MWTVEPGRILCFNGVPMFQLKRVDLGNRTYATTPSDADDFVRDICDAANEWKESES